MDAGVDHVDVALDDEVSAARRLRDRIDRRFDDAAELNGSRREAQLAGHDARDVEQIVDETGLMGRVALDRLERLGPRRRVELASHEEPRPAENRRQRRSKLVRERREELVLDAVGLAQLARLVIDDVRERGRVLGERALLRLELARDLAGAERSRDGGREVVRVDGFREEVERAAAERLDREIVVAEAGHEHDWSVRPELVSALEQLEPVRPGHADVADDDVVVLARDEGGGLRGRRAGLDGRPRKSAQKQLAQRVDEDSVVVDDEQARSHVSARCRFRTTPKVWTSSASNGR